jgi:negative regulator of flagellin synthesis FlgM
MPSVELSKLQGVSSARSLSETDRTQPTARMASASTDQAKQAAARGVSIEVRSEVDAVTPPIDRERVEQIRAALQDGSYPLVPTKIADAMIAAQISFELPR